MQISDILLQQGHASTHGKVKKTKARSRTRTTPTTKKTRKDELASIPIIEATDREFQQPKQQRPNEDVNVDVDMRAAMKKGKKKKKGNKKKTSN